MGAGVIETAGITFLVLIAVRSFHAGAVAKSILAAGSSIGLLATPWVVLFVERRAMRPALAASQLAYLGAGCVLAPALFPWLPLFVAGGTIGVATAAASIPLLTQMYQENYPADRRGRLFARAFTLRIGAAALFSLLGGHLLSASPAGFRWMLAIFAAALASTGFCLARCPTRPMRPAASAHPLRAFQWVRRDRLFRRTLICWMLLGFANLMMVPLRVEYLANPKYGPPYDAASIALFTGVAPNMARLVMSPVWGRLFDRLNFFLLRVALNVGFALGILSFFTSREFSGLFWGAIIYGVSSAGGDVAWGLWVTKFAPPGRVADYMAVHTFFTGARGVVAPFCAFFAASASASLAVLGWGSAGMILLATVMLIPEIGRNPPGHPPPAPSADLAE